MAIHPSVRVREKALVDDCDIGPDTRVWAFAHVLFKARVGVRCSLGEGVFIERGAVIGDERTIENGVAIWEGVELDAKSSSARTRFSPTSDAPARPAKISVARDSL